MWICVTYCVSVVLANKGKFCGLFLIWVWLLRCPAVIIRVQPDTWDCKKVLRFGRHLQSPVNLPGWGLTIALQFGWTFDHLWWGCFEGQSPTWAIQMANTHGFHVSSMWVLWEANVWAPRGKLLHPPVCPISGSPRVAHERHTHGPFMGQMELCYLGCFG